MNGLTRIEVVSKAMDEGNEVIKQTIKEQLNDTVLKFIQCKLDLISEQYRSKYGIDPELELSIGDVKSFIKARMKW